MDTPSWRITLTCGCVYRISSYPELRRPMLCQVEAVPDPAAPSVRQTHGLRMITNAERVSE